MNELIFWYTGTAIWAIIAIGFALLVLAAAIWGAVAAYTAIKHWNVGWRWCYMSADERTASNVAWRNAGLKHEDFERLMKFADSNKKRIAAFARGPLIFDRAPPLGTVVVLNDGSRARVVCQVETDVGGKWRESFEIRGLRPDGELVPDDWLTVQLDGRIKDHPVLRVIRPESNP